MQGEANANNKHEANANKEFGGSLVNNAIGAITAHIRNNQLEPGDKLPGENAFCKELSVSRTVVREAFRSLAAMHLIELNVGKRAVVAKLNFTELSPLIEHGVQTEQITIQQIYDVRRTIESRTTALAALRRSDEQAELILNHANNMHDFSGDPKKIMELDISFHLEIARASKNPVFMLIVGGFDNVTRQTWPVGWRSRTEKTEQLKMIDLHVEIAKAIHAGDPEQASNYMKLHFDESVQSLLSAGII